MSLSEAFGGWVWHHWFGEKAPRPTRLDHACHSEFIAAILAHSALALGERMRCSKCATENPTERKFCGDCGAPLANSCPKCGADNPLDKRFCGDCGAALSAYGAAAQVAAPGQSAPAVTAEHTEASTTAGGERRHLTVLFCDLVGSTEISARLDPEEWHEIAAQYQRTAAEAVTRLGGHVAKYLGDGLVVFFGWPSAHEDDGDRDGARLRPVEGCSA